MGASKGIVDLAGEAVASGDPRMKDAGPVDRDDVADPSVNQETGAEGSGDSHAEQHHAKLAEFVANDMRRTDQTGKHGDGRSVLIVVKTGMLRLEAALSARGPRRPLPAGDLEPGSYADLAAPVEGEGASASRLFCPRAA